jgi:hypothetical protein
LKVVDSSGWLEFFADGPLAEAYAVHLADLAQVVTPAIAKPKPGPPPPR